MSLHIKKDYQWLNKWRALISEKTILELGCGDGVDTQVLLESASSVIACDLNSADVERNRMAISGAQFLELNHAQPLPFENGRFDVVLASLSLHYFTWEKTQDIVAEISRVLVPEGVLICRLNSTQDVNYGASGYPEVERGLYEFEGQTKRFFRRQDVLELFGKYWSFSDLRHDVIDRYELPKSVWSCRVQKCQ